VPKDEVEDTPIFLLATAGMRLVEASQQKALLKEICSYTRANTKFLLPDCDLHVQVIPGATEGRYGWIAANYLLGGFDSPEDHAHGKGHHTYGFLDMGGASAQIAFAPNKTEAVKHANDLTLLRMRKLNGQTEEYKVFVTTWLEFGVNEARRRYVEQLAKDHVSASKHRNDPCLPKGLKVTTKGKIITLDTEAAVDDTILTGTGKFEECLKRTYPLLDKDAPCPDDPCLLHGVHVPSIDFDVNHFVGISEYWHTTHEIFEMAHKDKSYDFATYQERVKDFCNDDWTNIAKDISHHKWGKKVDEQTAYEVCFKASWLINVLHNGIGIPRVGLEGTSGSGVNGTKEVIHHGKEKGFLDPFQAVNKIQNTEVSWTLGKMVLYAASQVPPQDAQALPVGFGSNEPGIPTDFQYPSSAHRFDDDDDSFASDFHDSLFSGDSPRRIPGVLLFVFIVILAVFFLCGRERRSKLYRKFGTMLGSSPTPAGKRRRNFLAGKLPFFSRTPSVAYERVLEEGPDDAAVGDFELGAMADSDGSDEEQSKAGKSSGWATPRFDPSGHRPGSRNGVAGNAMDRNGLAVRTESRERLEVAAAGGGGRSRNGSPVRGQLGRR
jgi:golgi apyrase